MKIDNLQYPLEWDFNIVKMIYNEIFKQKNYIKYFDIKENDIIVDLGANIGLFSLFALKNYNINKVYMVEPSSQIFYYMFKNIINNIKDMHKCIFIKSGISENGIKGLYYKDIGTSLTDSLDGETIKTFSFIDFIKFYNIYKIDYLKIDIEGSEIKMFNEQTFDYLKYNKIDRICGEMHPMRKNCDKMVNILNKLKELNYDIILNSADGYEITNKVMNNSKLNNDMLAWDYYNQFLFYAKQK